MKKFKMLVHSGSVNRKRGRPDLRPSGAKGEPGLDGRVWSREEEAGLSWGVDMVKGGRSWAVGRRRVDISSALLFLLLRLPPAQPTWNKRVGSQCSSLWGLNLGCRAVKGSGVQQMSLCCQWLKDNVTK